MGRGRRSMHSPDNQGGGCNIGQWEHSSHLNHMVFRVQAEMDGTAGARANPHRPEHEAEAPWEASSIVLPQAELNRVDGRLDSAGREPAGGQGLELGQDQ